MRKPWTRAVFSIVSRFQTSRFASGEKLAPLARNGLGVLGTTMMWGELLPSATRRSALVTFTAGRSAPSGFTSQTGAGGGGGTAGLGLAGLGFAGGLTVTAG